MINQIIFYNHQKILILMLLKNHLITYHEFQQNIMALNNLYY